MSEECTTPDLLGLIRRTVDAVGRRDFDAAVAYYAEDAVWDASPMGVGIFEGRQAIRGAFEDWLQPYAEWKQDFPDGFHDLGNGVIFGVAVQRARLPGSKGELTLRVVLVTIWNGELIDRLVSYPDVDEARAAAERLAQERG